jgi:hypothetical protein
MFESGWKDPFNNPANYKTQETILADDERIVGIKYSNDAHRRDFQFIIGRME